MNRRKVAGMTMLMLGIIAIAGASPSWASVQAYSVANGTAGTQDFTGSLGLDFDVNSNIEITSLGVFDDLSNGLNRTISVAIFDRNTQSIVGPTLTFSGASDTLVNGYRVRDLANAISLSAGFQGSIVAWGYGANERNGNVGSGFTAPTLNDGGGLISFVGSGRYSGAAGVYPTTVDGGPENRYGAGTFGFQASAVPEPTTIAIWSSLLALGFLARRRFR